MRPKRTGKTSLTDDELTLFDVLFDKGLSLEQLYRKDFRLIHNLSHSHNLTPVQVRLRINRWIKAGWVSRRHLEEDRHNEGDYYDLTPAGGHLWELEREPLWDRFCLEASWSIGNGSDDPDGTIAEEEGRSEPHMTCILSPTPEIAWDFLHTAIDSRKFEADIQQAEFRLLPEEDLLPEDEQNRWLLPPWKDFPILYEIKLPTRDLWNTDWETMKARATWWRDVDDLEYLKAKLKELRSA